VVRRCLEGGKDGLSRLMVTSAIYRTLVWRPYTLSVFQRVSLSTRSRLGRLCLPGVVTVDPADEVVNVKSGDCEFGSGPKNTYLPTVPGTLIPYEL